jgi:hypothetical protein
LSLPPGHTTDVESFFRYLIDCAKDPRFNAGHAYARDQSRNEARCHRPVAVPLPDNSHHQKRLIEREHNSPGFTARFSDWGRGRDDAMNLTKYFMIKVPMDNTFGPTDMPSIWNLQKYKADKGMFMNLAGDSHDAYSVVMDSALGSSVRRPSTKINSLAT